VRASLRFGLPLIAVLALVPAILARTGGPHGNLYGMVVFFLSLPAFYGQAWLRDAGLVVSEPSMVGVVFALQYLTYLALVSLAAASVGFFRRRRRG
jgi:hypothetical protein